ncbi:MAG: glycosyltransferase [Candidatus Aenigmarchaeota archaeon]|nr:glycosyltransferase [Candidatus Aenigmarchaeota archaeon]
MEISVIVPVFNEAGIAEDNLLRAVRYLERKFHGFEVIAAEDASTDGTEKVLEMMERKGYIRHMHFNRRIGKGAAIKEAVLASKGKAVLVMDCDLPVSLDYIEDFVLMLKKYDIVTASRLMKGSKVKRPVKRSVASLMYNFLVRRLFRTHLMDHQCGFKVMRAKSIKKIINGVEAKDYFWDTEMLIRAQRAGLKVKEVPVVWNDRKSSGSKISVIRETERFGIKMMKLWLCLNKEKGA